MVCPRCLKDNIGDGRFCAACGTPLPGTPRPDATLTLPPSPRDFSTGELFAGRYRIIEEIGHGGMGRVFKAYDAEVGEKIALKLIRPDIAGDPAAVDRFRNELKLARRITHPNVCRAFDLGEDRGKAFFTMEYVEGKDLAHVLRMTGPLTTETALGYAAQICEGLAAAHRLGVVHRDLKPHNIMVDDAGGVKIMDFGIARTLIGGEAPSEGRRVGTPDYMSPEQAAGRPVDGRTDIYALGVILYEMITGKRLSPAEAPPGAEPRAAVLRSAALDPRVPADLGGLIAKCLAEDPAGRFQTADDLRDAISASRKGVVPAKGGIRRAGLRPMTVLRKIAPWILLLVLGTALFFRGPRTPKNPSQNNLAVLRLEDKSQGKKDQFFADFLTSGIRSRLAAADVVKIIAPISSDKMSGSEESLQAIGRKLNAKHVLSGFFIVENARLRVELALSDAVSNTQSWSNTYDESQENAFAIATRIAESVAGQLKAALNPQKLQAARAKDPVNAEALRSYLEGERAQADYRSSKKDGDYDRAMRAYQTATRIDPRYAMAYVGWGNLEEARYARTESARSRQALVRMRGWFQRASDLDPELAEATAGLAWAFLGEKNDGEAARIMRQAYARDPDNQEIIYNVGAFLKTVGLLDRAVPHLRKAAALMAPLDPLNASPAYLVASILWALDRPAESLATLVPIESFEKETHRFHIAQSRVFLLRREWDAADREIAAASKAVPANNEDARAAIRRLQPWLAAGRGRKEDALALLRDEPEPFRYEVTNAYVLLGEKDTALALMKEGFRTGFEKVKDYMYGYEYLSANPVLKALEGEPRFQALVRQAKAERDRWIKLCAGL